jgi:hypothetical protein
MAVAIIASLMLVPIIFPQTRAEERVLPSFCTSISDAQEHPYCKE